MLVKLSMDGTQPPEPSLLPVGFWRRYEDANDDPFDTRPWPVSSLIDRPFNFPAGHYQMSTADCMDVVEYCSLGYIESYEFGYATCRLCGANGPTMVSSDSTSTSPASTPSTPTRRRRRSAHRIQSRPFPVSQLRSALYLKGCTSLTDGTYCWPEGYSHYILHHRVSPPPSFVGHAKANLKQLREDHSVGPRKLWDTQLKQPRPAPPTTREWLKRHAASLVAVGQKPASERDRRCCCQQ